MIDHLILHPQTKEQVMQFLNSPAHATLLVGGRGVGKTKLATTLAAHVLGVEPEKLEQYPYITIVGPEKDSISIEAIRQLQRFLQLKTLGDRSVRRAVIVEHAETLTIEAQNAYLKLLEEPPADTIMILTANNQRALLPTILSRVQAITVYTPEEEALKQYFLRMGGQDGAAISQAYFLSGGLPGLMHALLAGDNQHPLTSGVAQAKAILQKQPFERLAMVEGLSKQKEEARYVVEALQQIAQTCLSQAAKKGDSAKVKQWHRILKVATKAHNALSQNANTKLVLDDMMLHI